MLNVNIGLHETSSWTHWAPSTRDHKIDGLSGDSATELLVAQVVYLNDPKFSVSPRKTVQTPV